MPKAKYAPGIIKRRRLFYATMEIPASVRHHFPAYVRKPYRNQATGEVTMVEEPTGKNLRRFMQSLGTNDLDRAIIMAAPILAGWRAAIARAKGRPDEAERYEQAMRKASADRFQANLAAADTDQDRQAIRDAAEVQAAYMALRNAPTRRGRRSDPFKVPLTEDAADFLAQATDQSTPFTKYLPQWTEQWEVSAETKEKGERMVHRFAETFPTVEGIRGRDVEAWLRRTYKTWDTARRNLAVLRGYWRWLQRQDVADPDHNPFRDIELQKARNAKRQHFEPPEVATLLATATGTLRDLILIAAYSGMRLEEICSMKLDNVNGEYFYVARDKTKTDAGTREVPIHPALQQTVARLKQESTDGYLLSGLKLNRHGKRSDIIRNEFSRLKTDLGFSHAKSFHSLRHTVATLLERAHVPEILAAHILGHKIKTLSYGTYSGGSLLKDKAEALARVSYPGIT